MSKEIGGSVNFTIETFTMTPGAVTTAGTKGTVVTDVAKYWRLDKFLFLRWDYRQSAGGTAGTGTYLFPIPSGLTIDTAQMGLDNTERTLGVVGTARSEASTVYWVGTVHVYNSTNLYASGCHALADGMFSATNTPLSTSDRTYSIQANWIPIVEWS